MLGIGLSVPQIAGFSSAPVYSPLELFAASEPGVWFDPSDLTTMFQDNNGSSPVTATGQTVGLILDKSKGLTIGSEMVSNGSFSNGSTGWTLSSGSSVSNGQLVVNNTVQSISAQATAGTAPVSGRWYRVTFTVVAVTNASGGMSIRFGGVLTPAYSTTGTFTSYVLATSTDLARVEKRGASAWAGTIDDISIVEVSGAHASQATSGSRPTYQVDGNGKAYLSFDGSDDSLATAAIDLSGANRLTLCAGVRKLSDVSVNTIVEFTSSFGGNNGSFNLSGPYLAGVNNFSFISKGSNAAINTVSGYTAPVTAVVTGLAHIAGPSNIIRINGTQVGSITTSQGTGNYSNSILYIGRRAGTSNPFNGRLYQLVIRAATTAGTDLSNLETYVNEKTGAY